MRVFIVDDDPGLRRSLGLLLGEAGYAVDAEGSPTAALARLATEPADLVLCDVRMPEMDGIAFLRRYRAQGGKALVIVMSAYGGDDQALAAMREGAYDYLPKPFRADEVLLTLRKAEERERLRDRVEALEAEVARWRERDLVADAPGMRAAVDIAERVAPHPTTVLITGESGVGKEVLARAIHRMSPRRDARFVAINCAAIPEALLEAELFGHARGAFTGAVGDRAGLFEEADGGTLLLDEIGDLPPALQVKLLRVLQEGAVRRVGESRERKVDVRVLAATARDLEAAIAAGTFREDLFYRLNVVRLRIPPLRERPEDMDRLVTVLLARAIARADRPVTLAPGAIASIKAHSWPGNIRELENALERAVVLSRDGVIQPEAFLVAPVRGQTLSSARAAPVRPLKDAVGDAEAAPVRAALAAAAGNREQAASLLGVSVRTLYYKMRELQIE